MEGLGTLEGLGMTEFWGDLGIFGGSAAKILVGNVLLLLLPRLKKNPKNEQKSCDFGVILVF